jgi:Ni/Fe-hydrogenase subunit HybB-like protein
MSPFSLLSQVSLYAYPNESEVRWSLLIVLYPFLTGLVAGAFILASLYRVFNIKSLAPVYRMSLLGALSFLIVAPMTLLLHLGHPERGIQIMATPHLTSAMAMFGFVYLWYLVVILLLEIWFDFRKDIVDRAKTTKGIVKLFYTILTLGCMDVSPRALAFDHRAGRFITVIGIPSAILLHGYVGFIFGSIKANPWWSSVLIPIIFIVSAIISGIAMMLMVYVVTSRGRHKLMDIRCMDSIGKYLMYALLFGLSLESLDILHRLYERGEWGEIFKLLSSTYLYHTMFGVQLFFGGIFPLLTLAYVRIAKPDIHVRKILYALCGTLVLIGVFAMRWNVVVGGQSFSKTLHGFTPFKLHFWGVEGIAMAAVLLVLPFVILFVLTKILPPWSEPEAVIPPSEELDAAHPVVELVPRAGGVH